MAPARAGAGRVGRRRGRARAAARARKSVRRRARIVLVVLEIGRGRRASFESGDPDAAGGDARRRARRGARRERQARRDADRRRERAAAFVHGGGFGDDGLGESARGGADAGGTGGGASRARARVFPFRAETKACSLRGETQFGRRGATGREGERRVTLQGADRSDGPGGGGGGARAPAATEMGTGMDEPRRSERNVSCCVADTREPTSGRDDVVVERFFRIRGSAHKGGTRDFCRLRRRAAAACTAASFLTAACTREASRRPRPRPAQPPSPSSPLSE